MARKPKEGTGEGAQVRRAMEGPDIEHDHLIGKVDKWNQGDRQRASSAAETRGEIGKFTEQTGIHPKALSMLRTIKKEAGKDGGDAKAMDIIRSLKKGLPMVESDITGQSTPDMWDGGTVNATDGDDLPDEDGQGAAVVNLFGGEAGDGGAMAEGGEDYLAEIASESEAFENQLAGASEA